MAGGAPGGGGRGAMGGFNGPIEQNPMFKNIKLDDTQKASIKKIQDGMRGKLMAVFQEAGGDRAKMRELMGKEREAMNEQIKAVLKPDQRTAFDANIAEMRAAMGEGGGRRNQGGAQMQRRALYKLVNNQPVEVPVLVGITDSTLTEIRPVEPSALKEGDMVITGKIGAVTQQQQGGQGGPGRGGMMPFGGP
jgi:Spy/CpxP family protein refolding chaperone